MLRRLICAAVSALLIMSMCSARAQGGIPLSAKSAVLFDCLTSSCLLEKNADERRGIASTTKIMTALVALSLYDADEKITVQPQWCGVEGSSMYLRAGEVITVGDLLYGLMLMSGNDAAEALSRIKTEKQDDFVALMNDKAVSLGLKDTSFRNPSGLDADGHYSSAHDLAVLASAALSDSRFAEIVSTKSAVIAGRYMTNHNRLLSELDGAAGVKTGFTKSCGRCLVSAVTRQGRTFVAVTLSAPDDWNDHRAMYASLSSLAPRTLLQPGQIASVPVVSAEAFSCPLYVSAGFEISLLDSELENIKTTISGPRIWYGETQAGEKYGTLTITLNGKTLHEENIYFMQSISQPKSGSLFTRLLEWLAGIFR